jgi:phosphatidate cytidylyltransferase
MKRILSAVVLIPIVVWVTLYSPHWAFVTALALVGLFAFREFDQIGAAQGIAPSGLVGMACGLAFLLAPEPAIPVLVLITLGLMVSKLRLDDLSQALPSVSAAVLGLVYIFGAWRCAAALREVNPHWLMIALLVSWAGDTAALYVGRTFGARKLAPVVSPAKTWEGAAGSLAGGMIAAVVYAHFLLPSAPLALVLAVGAAANVAGQFGDLCESAWKRGAQVKDSGTSIPGHGGWLDRIDSSLFSVPVVYASLKLAQIVPAWLQRR